MSWLSLDCGECGRHLGQMIYCGPTGSVFCDGCKEAYESERQVPSDQPKGQVNGEIESAVVSRDPRPAA